MADPTQGGNDDPFATPQGETAEASIVPHAPMRETDALELPTIEPGNYRVGEEAGRGAIGRVWRARDRRLGRPVAIKELLERRGHNEARFVREALVTARLQHPGIVPVYEAGRWPSGEPFYAMKFVEGRSLHAAVLACKTLNERMALVPNVLAVAETIAYAHGQGVVHRDLKPANVVVGEYGETVVIDWGLAKDRELADSLDGDEATDLYEITHAQMTRVGAVVGTPAYMPVEQARGEPVDERADVYAVGAMLYHVLAARPPYEGASDQVLASVLAGPPAALATRVDGLPRDLLAIVDKAMARSPADRYATGKELAQDLSRFLTGQLVGAREYSRFTLIGRWLKKHRYIVGAVSVLLAALAATAIVSARRIVHERNVAQTRSAQLVLSQARAVIDADPTAALAWLEQYPDFGTEWTQVQQIASDALSRGVAKHVWRGEIAAYFPGALAPDGTSAATFALDGVRVWDATSGKLRMKWMPPSMATVASFSPSGKVLWVGVLQGDLFSLDIDHAAAAPRAIHAHDGSVRRIVCSEDGGVVVTSGADGMIRMWRAGPEVGALSPAESWKGPKEMIESLAVDKEGRVWSSSLDGTVLRWTSGAVHPEVIFYAGHRAAAPMAISLDGSAMVTAVADTVLLWRDGQLSSVGRHRGNVTALLLRGDEIVSGGSDNDVMVWEPDGTSHALSGHTAAITEVIASRDGKVLASSDAKGGVRVWREEGVQVLHGLTREVHLAFARDGTTLMADSADGVTRLFETAPQGQLIQVSRFGIFSVLFASGGKPVVTTGKDGAVCAVRSEAPKVNLLGQHVKSSYELVGFDHGKRFVSGGWDGVVKAWTLDGARPLTWKHGTWVWSVDVAPDGIRVASADQDGTVLVHDLLSSAETKPLTVEGEARKVLFSPDGKQLAAAGTAGTIHVKTLPDGPDVVLTGHTDGVSALAFSADGRTLYSASWDGTLRIWDLATRKARVLAGHTQRIRTMALSPDGRTLASGSADRTIRIWDVATGTSRVLRGHTAEVRHVAFSPDGAWLASAGWDATVRLWHLGDGRSVVLRGHADLVHRVAFSPDGKILASAGEDGAVGLWNLADVDAVPGTPKELRAWLAATTTAVIGADETLATRP